MSAAEGRLFQPLAGPTAIAAGTATDLSTTVDAQEAAVVIGRDAEVRDGEWSGGPGRRSEQLESGSLEGRPAEAPPLLLDCSGVSASAKAAKGEIPAPPCCTRWNERSDGGPPRPVGSEPGAPSPTAVVANGERLPSPGPRESGAPPQRAHCGAPCGGAAPGKRRRGSAAASDIRGDAEGVIYVRVIGII